MKIVFGTVVYEQAWIWWKEFADSINRQTTQEFDMLILNDGLSDGKIELLTNRIEIKSYVCNIKQRKSISEIRIQLLQTAKNMGYDLIILGDFDDTFSDNRVKKIMDSWDSRATFYYHNLLYEGGKREIFEELPLKVSDIAQVLEVNFLGLSNTAINLLLINDDFLNSLEDVATNIFDWYLYSKILISGKFGFMVQNAYTVYRQQTNNLAGIQNNDYLMMCKEIRIKKEQYRLLGKDIVDARELLKQYEALEKLSEKELYPYMNRDKKNYWWSNLKVNRHKEESDV